MDFGIFYRLKLNNKAWLIDVVFYFSASLLIAAVFCWLIFILKIYIQNKTISDLDIKIQQVGAEDQKNQEKDVLKYKKKINDFALLAENHKIASNVFDFLQKETLPGIWFDKFGLQTSQGKIALSGESENLDALSRQVLKLENNELVKKVDVLSSSVGSAGKINFELSITIDQKVYDYITEPQ